MWAPPRRSALTPAVIAGIVVLVIALLAIPFILLSAMTGTSVVFFPFCGFILVILIVVIVLIAVTMGSSRRAGLPPPPPVQGPMVPAGLQGPVALNCPNCGAPPQAIDRFGVATCTYCGTRFLVR
jgi:hypothetical protein